MKRLLIITAFALFCTVPGFSQAGDITRLSISSDTEGDIYKDFPEIKSKPSVVFNEGLASAWVTRIVYQEDRSNFVFKDFLAGAYFSLKTVNMQPLNSMVRLAVYYPFTSTFNDFPQQKVKVIQYGIDLFAGVDFELNMWEYVRFNISPGFHFLYQTADRWDYINLGAAALVGVELPVSRRWTILINGIASLDSGNFGNNKTVEPYDMVYQYQLDIGVRYSKKTPNKYSYIKPKA